MIPTARRPHEVPRHEGAYKAPYEPITDQSAKERTKMANIIATYHRTGIMPGVARRQPTYGECPDMDFNESAQIAAEAASSIEEASLRAEFEIGASEASEEASEPVTGSADDQAEKPLRTDPAKQGSAGTENPVPELTNEGT